MLRTTPHGEDPDQTAGGDAASESGSLPKARSRPIPFSAGPAMGNSPATPPGEGKDFTGAASRGSFKGTYAKEQFGANQLVPNNDEIENQAQRQAEEVDPNPAEGIDFLKLIRQAESSSARYISQVNRRGWTQSYKAYNNEHFAGSKYTRPEWRNRSKFFRPKTRTAVKKDMAAVAASLHGNIDAISCTAGNESDPRQRASAAVLQELINYRTDGSRGKAAMSWFATSMGSRQNALITGVCLSKQYWKFELRKRAKPEVAIQDGQRVTRDVWLLDIDRPEVDLIPPENFVIDMAADWRNPAQSAAYVIIKWPLHLEEVHRKQESPLNPWNKVSDSRLLGSADSGSTDTSAIRRARESGTDRIDESQRGTPFQIVWVYEVFMRYDGEDYTFFTAGDRDYLTDPKPVRDIYPEQFGERPIVMGYGNLDAHRITPMSPVESWQQHQGLLNDMANLRVDAVKQNVHPVTKVVRGKQVDLDQVKRRAQGSVIMVQDEKDVTFDRPTDIPQSVAVLTREVELEMDDLAGQFNGQTVQNNNAASNTLGGLKLVSGAANAVQEYDVRVWIETWASPVLSQVARLEQFYEHDSVVLGICGDRAQIFKKYGISTIDDELMEEDVLVRVSVGLGAGDPAQRLQKFGQAVAIATPILQASPDFQSGKKKINVDAVISEIFSDAGYRDGGARFFEEGEAKQQGDPLLDLKAAVLKSQANKNDKTAYAAMLTALAAVAKQALGESTAENELADQIVGRFLEATNMGHEHGHRQNDSMLSARDHGHRHGMDIRQQGHQETMPQLPPGGGAAPPSGGDAEGAAPPSAPSGPPQQGGSGGPPAGPQPSYAVREAAGEPAPPADAHPTDTQQQLEGARQGMSGQSGGKYFEIIRGPDGQMSGFRQHDSMPPAPPAPPQGPPPMPPFAQPGGY